MRTATYLLLAMLLLILPGTAPLASAQNDPPCVGGRPGAPIKIEVFSDYQCPACREFYLQTMRQVLNDYADPGKVCVVYREFPLNQHQHAKEAARYGAAAMRMDQRTWALVTDALYQNQDKWEQDGKIEPFVAAALNKEDLTRLHKEMTNPVVEKDIERDISMAKERDVNQTPTFFVTNPSGKTEKIAGVVQYPILSRYLNSLLGQ